LGPSLAGGFLFIGLFVGGWPAAYAQASVELSGRLQHEAAYRVAHHPEWTKGLSYLQLQGVARPGGRSRLTVIGRAWYDAALDLVPPEDLNPNLVPGDAVSDSFHDVELKEAYLDLMTASLDLRLGRQIVRWGLLEGARITDRVNPLDFREFLFRDVEDRYIPLWMARMDWFPSWGQAQLLVIPELRFHEPAPAGSEWEEFSIPPGTEIPDMRPGNMEVATRLGSRLAGVDWTASYFYTWDDFPAAFRSIFGVGGQLTGVALNGRHERLQILGLTASHSMWGKIISLEMAYDRGKYLATDVGAMPNNEIQRDLVHWGVGVDMNWRGVDVSVSYFEGRVQGWRTFIPVPPVERAASLLVREEFFGNRLETRLLMLLFNTGNQYLARPQLGWKLTDHAKMTVGADLLGGAHGSAPDDPAGARDFRFVGFFRDHDRIHATISYLF